MTASRSRGLTVFASPRASRWMACSLTPAARAMRAEPWPITASARSRSRVPPASARGRRAALATVSSVVLFLWLPGLAGMSGHRLGLMFGLGFGALLWSRAGPLPMPGAAPCGGDGPLDFLLGQPGGLRRFG